MQPPDLEAALTNLADTLGPWTYALVAGLAFLETGAFVGLIAPGETAIVLGGVIAAQGDANLGAMLLIAWLAAAFGDLVSFGLGKRLGRRFLLARGPRRHRGATGTRGRLLPAPRRQGDPPRALHRDRARRRPFLAGASGLRLRAFMPWSLIGTAAWATTFTLLGYAFHQSFSAAAGALTHGALGLAVLAAAAFAYQEQRRSRGRWHEQGGGPGV